MARRAGNRATICWPSQGGSSADPVTDRRPCPATPSRAVSAAIIRDGKVLVVRRARPPAAGLYTLPGGGVEVGETLLEAVGRGVRGENAPVIQPAGLAGQFGAIPRGGAGPVGTEFVYFAFA